MKKNPNFKDSPALRPRFRITRGKEIAFGPGKAELLALVGETGSISEAASRMGMSYMRAWTLVQTMNACFTQPVVKTVRGGNRRGGAELTDTGSRVLELYRQIETDGLKAVQANWRAVKKLLRA
jgi:molybdate transport system regulatory protein